MATRGDIQVNNFVKGLITESSPLTFPAGASLDELNFKLKRDGTRERRLGLDLEDGYGLHDLGLSADILSTSRITAYRWSIPNGDITSDIGVIQVGNSIYFLNLHAASPSASLLNGGVPVTALGTSNDQIMNFATINNYLIGVSNALEAPYLFTYNRDTDTITTETSPIMVRDLWGVDDGLGVNDRPTSLSAAHHYNLLNQGWSNNIKTTCSDGSTAIDCTFKTFGVYPSNGDQWTQGRVEDLTSTDVMKYDPEIAGRMWVNTGQVARGHFIIPVYARGSFRSNITGLTLPIDRERGAITSVASYAGRVFYSGILSSVEGGDSRSPSFSGTVFFSQIFTDKINLVKCYQEADPTNPDINDIVDTDGGLIQIPECSYIYALKPIKQSLFVFAANGVWEIRGDEGGFRATSYQVNKISNIGVYAPKSIVEVNGVVLFWGNSGIYAISPNQFGTWDTQDLTQNTIQRLYNAIPDASKRNARGMYDNKNNRARWLYYSQKTKTFGNPIDIDEVPATIPASITSPITIAFGVEASNVDCVAINSSQYVIVITRFNSGSQFVYGIVAEIDSNNVITFGTPVVLENALSTFSHVSVCKLSSNRIFISALSDADNVIYGIHCYVSGTTISKLVSSNLVTIWSGGTESKVVAIDSNRVLLNYNATSTAYNTAVVVSVTDTSLTFNTPTIITTPLVVSEIECIKDKSGNYYTIVNVSNTLRVVRLLVSGTTVTVGSLGFNTTGEIGSTQNTLASPITNKYILTSTRGVGGFRVNYIDNTTVLSSINSTSTSAGPSGETLAVNNKVYCVYSPNATNLELEEFEITSNTLSSVRRIVLASGITVRNESTRFSDEGFTTTKYPLVYIDNTTTNGTVTSIIFELGNN